MDSEGRCAPVEPIRVCWFCKKGRHAECMTRIPVNQRSSGPHDCTFEIGLVRCECSHQEPRNG